MLHWCKNTNSKRIKLYKNQGEQGIINCLRLGLNKCSGNYITRMDSDDIMHKNKLKELYNLLKIKGKGYISTSKVEYFSKKGVGDGYKKYENWLNKMMEYNTRYRQEINQFIDIYLVSEFQILMNKSLNLFTSYTSLFHPLGILLNALCLIQHLFTISSFPFLNDTSHTAAPVRSHHPDRLPAKCNLCEKRNKLLEMN